MEKFTPDIKRLEKVTNQIVLQRPIGVEIFAAGLGTPTIFDDNIAENPTLQAQVRERDRISQNLIKILREPETTEFSQFEAFYGELAHFLSEDPNNSRIILYLPFEVLPDLHFTHSKAAEDFVTVYKEAWFKLLFESNPRANFVDGDVLEPGLGEPERTRKVAHFIPWLLGKNILDEQDLKEIIDVVEDPELLKSIAEGIMVAHDLGFRNEELTNFARQFLYEKPTHSDSEADIQDLNKYVADKIALIESRYAQGSEYTKGLSKKRIIWERKTRIDEVLDKAAVRIANAILEGEADGNVLKMYGEAGVKGVFHAAEKVFWKNQDKSQEIVALYLKKIRSAWKSGNKRIKDAISVGLNHWLNLGLINSDLLDEIGVKHYDLSSIFPVDLESIAEENTMLLQVVEKIKNDNYLSENIFPVFIVFGSRVKGFSTKNSDLDVAIFVKPQVTFEKRREILENIKTKLPQLNSADMLEYWVSEQSGKFSLRVKPNEIEGNVAGPETIHFLFGGVWFGEREDIQKIYKDIAGKYLDLSRVGGQKELVRMKLLRMLELDQLQVRLMHKGYSRTYASNKPRGTKNSYLIDWNSDFWDPGYRKIATLLFLSRVFLPDLRLSK